jgi:hypothetical protein
MGNPAHGDSAPSPAEHRGGDANRLRPQRGGSPSRNLPGCIQNAPFQPTTTARMQRIPDGHFHSPEPEFGEVGLR